MRMTDTEQELRQLLSEALDVRVVHGVEHALWRVRVKRALARQEDAAGPGATPAGGAFTDNHSDLFPSVSRRLSSLGRRP